MGNIVETNKLTTQQVSQIRALEKQCSAFDGTKRVLSLSSKFNQHADMPCFFLLYEGEELQGVLTIFALASEPAEISALVLPTCRRKGHFRALLKTAKAQLTKFDIRDILFVHETSSAAGKQMIEKWHIAPRHSEYLLVYDKQRNTACVQIDLLLEFATEKDIADLLKIFAGVLDASEEGFADMLHKSISGEKTQCFKATFGGEIVGMCSTGFNDEGRKIFGVAIAPAHQGRGFGRAMIDELIRYLLDNFPEEILLEVDSDNSRAYALYTTSGFGVRTQIDYYPRRTEKI
jgi:ribosomal protein S18 acetylase RimI-like enzyme